MNMRTVKLVTELRTLPLGTQLQVVAALLDGLDGDRDEVHEGPGCAAPCGHTPSPLADHIKIPAPAPCHGAGDPAGHPAGQPGHRGAKF
jgi:hypothetical protein